MRSAVAFCLCIISMAVAAPGFYTDKYDNVDLDEILGNRRLLLPYMMCVVDEGKCSPDGKELKQHIAEALQDDCSQCTEKQKTGSKRVIAHIYKSEPEYWGKLKAKYDPENNYSKKYGYDK